MPATPVTTPVVKRWAVHVLASSSPRRRFSRFEVPEFPVDLPDGDDAVSAVLFCVVGLPLLLVWSPLWLLKLAALLLDLLVVLALVPLRLLARVLLLR